MATQLPETETFTLPSGATAELRTAVKFGATIQLERIGARMAARMNLRSTAQASPAAGTVPQGDGGGLPPGVEASMDIDPDSAAEMAITQKFFALTYMLVSWSLPSPIPTLKDLSPLEDLPIADGRALLAECQARYDRLSGVDFSPTPDPGETPFGSSSASEPTPPASMSTDGSQPATSSTA